MIPAAVSVLIFLPMLLEAVISRKNETHLRSLGANEPAGDVYRAMQVAYPAGFVAMLLEGWWRQPPITAAVVLGFGIFLAAKLLKYWAMATLGSRWTFRVLVPPGSRSIESGPYRFARHPNYVAVTGEFIGVALMTHAIVTAAPVTIGFVTLMRRRVHIEEAALRRDGQ